jgi:hypothetical protein
MGVTMAKETGMDATIGTVMAITNATIEIMVERETEREMEREMERDQMAAPQSGATTATTTLNTSEHAGRSAADPIPYENPSAMPPASYNGTRLHRKIAVVIRA